MTEGLLIAAGALLIVCAFALTVYNTWESNQAKEESEKLLREVKLAYSAAPEQEPEAAAQNTNLQEQEDVFAILGIPSLDLQLPVWNQCTEEFLKLYPCRYAPESCKEGQFVIAGHNYKSHFKKLSSLKIGESIFLEFADGNQQYVVSELIQISGDDRERFFSGEWDLSLFTCDFSGKRREVVRCIKTPEDTAAQQASNR